VPKQNGKTSNVDTFGVKIVSLDDIVTEDYGKDFIEYDKKESEEFVLEPLRQPTDKHCKMVNPMILFSWGGQAM